MVLLLDGLGIFYITFAALYSSLFFSGCAIVWMHRSLPLIRMRNPVQMLGALVLLHVYLVLCLLAYPLNGMFPCDAEYWVMAIYFPCGIGLFQASNQRLLIISREQMNLAKGVFPAMKRHTHIIRLLADFPARWRAMVWRYKFWVYIGLVFQVGFLLGTCRILFEWLILMSDLQSILSLTVFLISRKFHSFGVVSEHLDSAACRRGWEW